jgi:hypothetical protein
MGEMGGAHSMNEKKKAYTVSIRKPKGMIALKMALKYLGMYIFS